LIPVHEFVRETTGERKASHKKVTVNDEAGVGGARKHAATAIIATATERTDAVRCGALIIARQV